MAQYFADTGMIPPGICKSQVEMLVQQTLDLDRPWRERRDMLSGVLSAASVEEAPTPSRLFVQGARSCTWPSEQFRPVSSGENQ